MLLYDIFIAPIELVIQFIFHLSYEYTDDYLISTILLSLSVSILLLPFYYWAGSLQNKEKEIFDRLKPSIDEFKRAFKGSELHAVTKTLYRQNNYHPIYSLRSLAGLLIQLPFFIAAYNFLSHYEAVKGVETFLFHDLGAPDAWLAIGFLRVNIMPFIMTVINLSAGFLYLKNSTKSKKVQLWALALIFLVLLYNSPSILLLYWTCNNLFYLCKNIFDKKIIPELSTRLHTNIQSNKRQLEQNKIITLCFFISSFLLFILPALQIIASAPGEFSNRGLLVGIMFYFFLLLFSTLSFIAIKMKGAVKGFCSFLSLFICFYFLTNFFVFDGDYGLMDFFIFHRPDMLEDTSSGRLYNILTIAVLLFFTGISLRKIRFRALLMGLSFVSLMLFSSGFSSLIRIANYSEDSSKSAYRQVQSGDIKPKFYFSKYGKNVLIIFFDRFIGGFVPDILKDVPRLKHELTGFTWYPNTLSPGIGTPVGYPPIFGGYKFCDIPAMEEDGYDWIGAWKTWDDVQMQKRLIESISFMVNKFVNAGYRSFISDPAWLDPKKVENISNNSHSENLIGRYRNIFFPDSMVALEENGSSPVSLVKNYLLPFSLFKISPSSLRNDLYNKGRWWNKNKLGVDNYWINGYLNNLSLALAWPLISQVDESLKGSFMFASNCMTHDTCAALDNGKFQTAPPKDHTKKKRFATINRDELIAKKDLERFKNSYTAVHFYSSKEALIRTAAWIKWMKKNGVYDNTNIVIVSDHGRGGVYNPMFEKQQSKDRFWYGAYHAVFMTKDFKAAGDLKTDNSFMTNADVPSIVLSAVDSYAKEKYGYNKAKGFRVYTKEGKLTIKDNIFVPDNLSYQP